MYDGCNDKEYEPWKYCNIVELLGHHYAPQDD